MYRRIIHPLIAAALACCAATAPLADTLVERTLARAVVIHCRSTVTAPVVIYLPDGTEEPAITGAPIPAHTDCVLTDSRIDGRALDGRLLIWSDDAGVIEEVIYDADIVGTGDRRYRASGWGNALSYRANGARYRIESRLAVDDDGAPAQFDLTLLRRTSDLCQETSGEIAACRDRATIILVEIAPGTTAMLDYRPEQ